MGSDSKLVDTSCPRCNSKMTLFRKRTQDAFCRKCGFEFIPDYVKPKKRPKAKKKASTKKPAKKRVDKK